MIPLEDFEDHCTYTLASISVGSLDNTLNLGLPMCEVLKNGIAIKLASPSHFCARIILGLSQRTNGFG